MDRTLAAWKGILFVLLGFCLALCPSCAKEETESMIACFSEYHTKEWTQRNYTEAVYGFLSFDLEAFFAEHGRAITYEIWQSQADTEPIYTYTKLTGIDTERCPFGVWARWAREGETWRYVSSDGPDPYEQAVLLDSFTMKVPQLEIPRYPADGPAYEAMAGLLEEQYGDNELAETAFLNTYEHYAIVVLEKEDYRLTEEDDYQFHYVYMVYEEGEPAKMAVKRTSYYGIDYRNRTLLELCDDVVRCNAVYPFK